MRLVQRLFRVLVIVAAAAVVLGGAAALGSTLFDEPPRDADEFAQWVEAGSERSGQAGKAEPAKRKRTPAEPRFVRELNAMCTRHERESDEIPAPRTSEEMLAYFERFLPVARRHHEEARSLDPPRRYRADLKRLLELDESGLTAIEAMRSALVGGDEGAYGAALAKLNVLVIRLDRVFRPLGATACLSD